MICASVLYLWVFCICASVLYFLQVFCDLCKCFVICASVLYLCKCFVFVQVFCICATVLYFRKCFVPMSHRTNKHKMRSEGFSTTWPNLFSNTFPTVGEF